MSLLAAVVLLAGCPKRVTEIRRSKQAVAQPRTAAPARAEVAGESSRPPKAEAAARYDQPGEAAEYARQKRLPPGATDIPVERYLDAQTHINRMPQYASAEARWLPSREQMRRQAGPEAVFPAWTPLGPGNVSGRTRGLVVHPTNPQVLYASGAAGGVWKTTNGGAAWTPLADLLDTRNPDTLYAGTGEGFLSLKAACSSTARPVFSHFQRFFFLRSIPVRHLTVMAGRAM
jgi:hypothetical protein